MPVHHWKRTGKGETISGKMENQQRTRWWKFNAWYGGGKGLQTKLFEFCKAKWWYMIIVLPGPPLAPPDHDLRFYKSEERGMPVIEMETVKHIRLIRKEWMVSDRKRGSSRVGLGPEVYNVKCWIHAALSRKMIAQDLGIPCQRAGVIHHTEETLVQERDR